MTGVTFDFSYDLIEQYQNVYRIEITKSLFYSVFSSKITIYCLNVRSIYQRCSIKKLLLEISQNSKENTCAIVSFLIKLQAKTAFKKFEGIWPA